MKREITKTKKSLLIVYRVFLAVIIVLILLLVSGSLFAVIRDSDSGPLFRIGGKNGGTGSRPGSGRYTVNPNRTEDSPAVFTGIGSLRIPSGNATVVLSISFPYPSGDRPFTEELVSRIGDFRSVANVYFSSIPSKNITAFDEEAAKKEILKRYNALLRLGKIETLYFTDFIVLE